MENKGKYYITTAIAYSSGKPHIGNVYEIVLADAIARYKRMTGYDVRFQTGTDEHGQKIEEKAKAAGKTPQQFVDDATAVIKEQFDLMNLSYDKFMRTTDPYHEAQVQKMFKKLYDQGDIYKSEYEGWYCTPCESFYTESQLVDGKCPDCGRPVEKAKEEAQTDEQFQQIRRSELSWRYWKCANKCSEFSRLQFPYVYMNANKKLHDDLKEMGVLVFGEGAKHELSDCELLYLYRDIHKWTTLYEEWFWDILNPVAVRLYEVLGKIYNLSQGEVCVVDDLPADTCENRFYLQFVDRMPEDDDVVTSVTDTEVDAKDITIYTEQDDIVVSSTPNVELRRIVVVDMAGKHQVYNVSGRYVALSLPLNQGIYTVHVIGDNAVKTEKVHIY